MNDFNHAESGTLNRTQATELSQLLDIEACWENMRKPASKQRDVGTTLKDLSAKQKAYEAFRVKMAAYNTSYKPAHVPELLLNTPARLGLWCRMVEKLHRQLAGDPAWQLPVNLLPKAYRWADQIAVRLNFSHFPRPSLPATIDEAIHQWEDLIRWCDEPVAVAPPELNSERAEPLFAVLHGQLCEAHA